MAVRVLNNKAYKILRNHRRLTGNYQVTCHRSYALELCQAKNNKRCQK